MTSTRSQRHIYHTYIEVQTALRVVNVGERFINTLELLRVIRAVQSVDLSFLLP